MFQYRAVLVRLRQGDSERDIARSRLMGRPKVAALRALAMREGWLDPDAPLPEDAAIAAAIGQARRARSTISSVEPFRELVARWAERGVNGVAIHAALPWELKRAAPALTRQMVRSFVLTATPVTCNATIDDVRRVRKHRDDRAASTPISRAWKTAERMGRRERPRVPAFRL